MSVDITSTGTRQAAIPVADSQTVAPLDAVAVATLGDATAANRGFARRYTRDLARAFFGFAAAEQPSVLGDDSEKILARTNAGILSVSATLTGVTQADVGRVVYLDDHETLSLTRSARGAPVGFVQAVLAVNTAEVGLWTAPLLAQYAVTRYTTLLATIPLSGTDTTVVHRDIVMPHHCRLVATRFATVTAPAGGGAVGEIQFARLVGGSGDPIAVTGGEVAVATGTGDLDAANDEADGAAITGTNRLHEGDHLRIQNAVTDDGTFSGGLIEVYGTFECELGQ